MASRLRAQLRRLRRNRLARARRGLRHDVVFYMPGLGPVLSAADSAPAGGAETQVLMLAKALAKQGASIAIMAYAIVVQTSEQVELCERSFKRIPVMIKSLSALQEPQSDEPEAFLWAGRLAHYKQPLEFVELARAVPEAQFWLVGVPVPPSPRQ